MAKTFVGTITSTIELDAAVADYNPVTIAATVVTSAGDGVYGRDLAWSVTNRGTIDAGAAGPTDGGQTGIRLLAGGTVINGSAALTSASITGGDGDGVRIGLVPGTVINFGTIAGNDRGIQLDFGGSITNGSNAATAASIVGDDLGGIYISNGAGTVTNFGTVAGLFSGVRLDAGGIIANRASGLIAASGQGIGVFIGGDVGAVANLGTIVGNIGVGVVDGGTVINGTTSATDATIASTPFGRGVVLGTGGGTLTNFGSVSGYYGVLLQGVGKVTNQLGALIAGADSGGRGIVGGAAAITNFGTVTGATGMYLGAAQVTNGSAAATAASIAASYGAGVFVNGLSTITNFATISGGRGVQLTGGGTVKNGSAASTVASITGGGLGGVVFSIGGPTGSVANFGTISGAYGVLLGGGGSVTNGSAAATGAAIFGTATFAVGTQDRPGTVTNFGTISGFATGVALENGGRVVNGSSISSSAVIATAGTATIGINISGTTGNVSNFGAVAGYDGILLQAGGLVANQASGSIAGTRYGFRAVGSPATVTNLGTIAATYSTFFGQGGKLVNGAGTASGAAIIGTGTAGIGATIYGGPAQITNAGTIAGTRGVFVDPADTGAVQVVNSGTIAGSGGIAVQLGGGNDRVTVQPGAVFDGTVLGGAGSDTVAFEKTGGLSIAGFSGFEKIILSSAAFSAVAVTDANFAGVTGALRVMGGDAGNRIDAAAVSAANLVIEVGGAGTDRLIAGARAILTGNGGNDLFVFTEPGANRVTDFAGDRIAFSDIGFDLGLPGASNTAQPLPTALFTSNATGGFTNTNQRFAYNTANGKLFFDADGSAAGSSRQLVSSFDGTPLITAADLFYVT